MSLKVSNRIASTRIAGAEPVPVSLALPDGRVVAVFEIEGEISDGRRVRSPARTGRFLNNAAILSPEGAPEVWLEPAGRRNRMESHFVAIDRVGDDVELVCFRGERFRLDPDAGRLSRVGSYEKY